MHNYVEVSEKDAFVKGRIANRKHLAQPNVFEDIAQEAISVCRQSLSSAAEIIAAKPTSSTTHGNLFLVRHLLILKEMTASVDLVRRDRTNQVDVGMIAALSTLLANALYMVGAGGLLGINPRRVTNVTDAKAVSDGSTKRLRSASSDSILTIVRMSIAS